MSYGQSVVLCFVYTSCSSTPKHGVHAPHSSDKQQLLLIGQGDLIPRRLAHPPMQHAELGFVLHEPHRDWWLHSP